ncbi:phage integrase SAM-like domain-containing protein, partial [Candidatus Roizmanbacteria bacterium]|nr:phage integrase SAM-like domain-containing protein [Candidatus Roizmanbacteria bacterium]
MQKGYNLYNLEPQFRNFLTAENVSSVTLKNYLSDLRHFFGWGNLKLKSDKIEPVENDFSFLDENFISEYRSYLLENSLPHKTINRRLSTVRKFCSFCISQGWLKENPAKKISNIGQKEISNVKYQISKHAQEPENTDNNKAQQSPKNKTSVILNSFQDLLLRFRNKSRLTKKPTSTNQFPNPLPNLPSTPGFGIQYYIAFLILLIFVATLGAGIYNQFFLKSERTFAYPSAPVTAGRLLSFQGRLTDAFANPITTATNVTYKLYNVSTGGSALYTAGPCSTTPDQDGVFNVLIGGVGYIPTPPSSTYNSLCGSEIDTSIFSENPNVYLGITVAGDSEMLPRQQIANVGYAINAETLQGLPPGSTVSTVPYINSDGNILMSAAAPGIRSQYSSATFTISSANATTIQSAGNGDIILQATESGALRFRTGGDSDTYTRIFVDTSANGGNVGIGTINPLAKLDVNGNASISGNLTLAGGVRTISSTAYNQLNIGDIYTGDILLNPGTGKQIRFYDPANYIDSSGNLTIAGILTTTGDIYAGSGITTYNNAVSDDTVEATKFCTGDGETNCVTDFSSLSAGSSWWTMNAGGLYPINSTLDAFIGGTATSSAKFAFINVNSGNPTASISGNLAIASPTGSNPSTTYDILNGGTYNLRTSVGGDSGLASRFFVNNAGNVGIGDTNPNIKLSVIDTKNSESSIRITNADTGAGALSSLITSNGSAYTALGMFGTNYSTYGSFTANRGILYNTGANGSAFINSNTSAPFIFANNTYGESELLRITGAGYIGIGTPDPTAKLDIAGSASTSGTLAFRGTTDPKIDILNGENFGIRISVGGDVGLSEIFTALNSGNIGIGDTTPDHKLDVAGNIGLDAGSYINFGDTDGTTGYGFRDNSGNIEFKNSAGSWTGIGSGGGDSWWTMTAGGLYPVNSTLDAFIGGTATSSAKFAFLNVNSGVPTASIAGSLANVSTYITGDGNLATTNMQPLTLGGSTTGDINFFSSANHIDSSGNLVIAGNLTVPGTTTFNTQTYTWPLTQLANGVLQTNGTGTLSWYDVDSSLTAGPWTVNSGSIYPDNSTLDLFIGGTSTSSAKFAFINVNSGNPTASISGNLALAVPTGAEPTAKLNIYNGGTFDIQTSVGGDDGLASRLFIKNNGDVGLGTTNPQGRLDISGSTSTITNSAGDITIDAASNLISFAGDTLSNFSQALGASGTVSAPTYSFTSSTNTGLYLASSNVLRFATNGSDRVTIDDLGNVGIGLTSLSQKFSVRQDNPFDIFGLYDGTNNTSMLVADGGTTTFKSSAFDNVFNFDGVATWTNNTNEAKTIGGTPFTVVSDSNDFFYVGLDHKFATSYFDIATALSGTGVSLVSQYYNGGWVTLTVTDNTNIFAQDGTITFTAPSDWTATTVNGVADKYWVRFSITYSGISTAPTAYIVSPTTGSRFYVYGQNGDTQPAFYVNDQGNVGMGTTTPNYKLDVAGVVGANYYVDNQNNAYGLDPAGTTNFGGFSLKITGGALLAFDSGLVGIGNQTPVAKLDLQGAVVGKALAMFNETGNQALLTASAAGITKFTVNHDGSITLAGQTTAPTSLNGGGLVSGTIYYNNTTVTGGLNGVNGATNAGVTTGDLFLYGQDSAWHRIALDMTQYSSSSANIANTRYIEIAHNQNTFDISLTGWVKDIITNLWKRISDFTATVKRALDNEFNPEFTQKEKVTSVSLNRSQGNFGTGADGTISLSGANNINTQNRITGRTCPDGGGGDAVNYSVSSFASDGTYVDLTSSPSYPTCINVDDEVLIINLEGSWTSTNPNLGNWETLRV